MAVIPKASAHLVQPSKRSDRLLWLDSIKGLAILGIILYHTVLIICGPHPFDHPKDDWLPLVERLAQLQPRPHDTLVACLSLNALRYVGWLGYQGVHLFLVASGFGLTWSLARRSLAADLDLRQFLRRRLWRVFPIYWAAHFFFLLFQALVGQFVDQPRISLLDGRFYLSLAALRFLPETFFYISPAWWYVWLILQLYMVFPALWAWLRRKGLRHFWIGTIAITLVSRFVLLIIVGSNREIWSMGIFFVTRLFEFTFGMGLAYWLAQQPNGLERLWRKRWPLLVACLSYPLALALSFTVVGSVVSHSLIAVSLFGITYAVSQYGLLATKYLRQVGGWLGKQSYGLMILHQPILWWFIPQVWGQLPYALFSILLALTVILCVLGSAAFSATVERVSGWAAQAASALWLLAVDRRTARSANHKV
jgi:peptidoglycan/LPS O-acetylase OafA/YrhL